jgi:hypothetical protein
MISFGPAVWDRMVAAVEKVRERLHRATSALEAAGVPYAVTGGNAVAAWVARVDPAAVRNTQDVDILLRPADLPNAIVAMEAAGFVYRHSSGIDMFLDGAGSKARDAVHVLAAGVKVRKEYDLPAADVDESDSAPDGRYRHVNLDALVRMKLTSFRRKDQVHIQDLIDVGLVDESWLTRVHPVLAPRLKQILDDPDG